MIPLDLVAFCPYPVLQPHWAPAKSLNFCLGLDSGCDQSRTFLPLDFEWCICFVFCLQFITTKNPSSLITRSETARFTFWHPVLLTCLSSVLRLLPRPDITTQCTNNDSFLENITTCLLHARQGAEIPLENKIKALLSLYRSRA